jgi:hypothetical protein
MMKRRILNFLRPHYEKTIFWMMMQFGCTRVITSSLQYYERLELGEE